MNRNDKIYIAGHRGLVGSAIVRALSSEGYTNIIVRTHNELDLTNQLSVNVFFEREKPDYVFLAAAKVGGIMANSTQKADFIYINSMIASNVIFACCKHGVKKILNLGSSCIYPKMASQPLQEKALLTGPLEETNDAYALAKISAIKMCNSFNEQYDTNFISAMPTNLYGPFDNFDLTSSHVLPALIRKFHEAKNGGTKVVLWGDGSPLREFLYSEDLAEALLFLMNSVDAKDMIPYGFVNVGSGVDLSIKELAETVKSVVGFQGEYSWDSSKPNGTPRKLMDVSHINRLGWKATTGLREGIQQTYQWFLDHYQENK